jgi:hypothetical protein
MHQQLAASHRADRLKPEPDHVARHAADVMKLVPEIGPGGWNDYARPWSEYGKIVQPIAENDHG